jgi:hypothetical protein
MHPIALADDPNGRTERTHDLTAITAITPPHADGNGQSDGAIRDP